MKPASRERIIEEGIQAIYEELGPAKTVRFFQLVGVGKGDTLEEIEAITEKLSREEALSLVRNASRVHT